LYGNPTGADIIGRSFRYFRQNFRQIIQLLIAPAVWACLASLALQLVVSGGIDYKSVFEWWKVGVVAFALLVALLAKWILITRQLVVVRLSLGFADDQNDALHYMMTYKWHILALLVFGILFVSILVTGLIVLTALLAYVGTPVFVLPILLSGACISFGLLSFATISGFIIFSVIACEGGTLSAVINRGISLCFNQSIESLRFGSLIFLVMTATSYAFSLPMVALSIFDVMRQGITSDTYQMPLYVMLVGQVWESFINMLTWTVMVVAFGFFYFELCRQTEGLDIMHKLHLLQSAKAGTAGLTKSASESLFAQQFGKDFDKNIGGHSSSELAKELGQDTGGGDSSGI
jgi:hypothetical protein